MKTFNKELLDSITSVKTTNANVSPVVIKYDSSGKNDKDKKNKISDEDACALSISAGKNKIFKIKRKRGGQLFNPLNVGMLYSLSTIDRLTNEPMFTFQEVSEKAFNIYIEFLNARHESLLLLAERELIHG